MEGLGDGSGDVLRPGDQEVVLGDRHGDAADVRLLEGVGADRGRRDLAGDGHHRDRVHVGVGDRRHQVRGARPAGRHADADAPGGLGVPGGRVAGSLLVPDQDVPDRLGVEQRVVGRQDRAARDPEHHVRADALERVHQRLRPGGPDLARAGDLDAGRLGRGGRPRDGPCDLRRRGRRGFGGTRLAVAGGRVVRRAGGQVPRAGSRRRGCRGGARGGRPPRSLRSWPLRAFGPLAARHLLGHRYVSIGIGWIQRH